MHNQELVNTLPIAVTEGVVKELYLSNREVFSNKSGGLDLRKCLFALGFDVDNAWHMNDNTLVGLNSHPQTLFKTKTYHGTIRKEVVRVTDEGKIIYHKTKLHKLYDIYMKYEILTTAEVPAECKIFLRQETGTEQAYRDGCKREQKYAEMLKAKREEEANK